MRAAESFEQRRRRAPSRGGRRLSLPPLGRRSRVLGDEARSACAAAVRSSAEPARMPARASRARGALRVRGGEGVRAPRPDAGPAAAAVKAFADFKHAARWGLRFTPRRSPRRVSRGACSRRGPRTSPGSCLCARGRGRRRTSSGGPPAARRSTRGRARRRAPRRSARRRRPAYADIHRLVARSTSARQSGVRVRGAPGRLRSRDTNAATELKRLKRLAGSVGRGRPVAAPRGNRHEESRPSASDGPSTAARAEGASAPPTGRRRRQQKARRATPGGEGPRVHQVQARARVLCSYEGSMGSTRRVDGKKPKKRKPPPRP